MSPEEIDALPTQRRRRKATPEESRKTGALWIEWIDDRIERLDCYRKGDPMWHVDSSGTRWTVHSWDDGEQFKRPFFCV